MIIQQDAAIETRGELRERFPRLAALGLSGADLVALETQGFVSAERLPSGRVCHKLRFRRDQRKQQVRYIGVDKAKADQVRHELEQLQAGRRLDRRQRRLAGEARSLLREVKRRLTPHLAAAGFEFHGHQPRRKRRAASTSAC
jgi:hypothetical protein